MFSCSSNVFLWTYLRVYNITNAYIKSGNSNDNLKDNFSATQVMFKLFWLFHKSKYY